jgi:MFS superfamily sulfate permease-like transporter
LQPLQRRGFPDGTKPQSLQNQSTLFVTRATDAASVGLKRPRRCAGRLGVRGCGYSIGYGIRHVRPCSDKYFANGALAGLYAAFFVAIVSVVLGDKTTTVYAPRINSTFFLGALLYGLVHSEIAGPAATSTPLVVVVFFVIIFLGGVFQASFGLVKVGTLLKYTPHPVVAGFQNTAAALLFLVQLANVSGFEQTKPFTFVLTHPAAIKPLSVLLAALTFGAMWNSRKIVPRIPPLLTGLAVGTGLYYALIGFGLREYLGPIIGDATRDALSDAPWGNIGELTRMGEIFALWPTILGGGLALAIIASIDALLCAKLVTQPGDARAHADHLLLRLGIGNGVAASFGGITAGINIGPSLANRAFGARTPLSVLVNAAVILLAFTVLFPIITRLPRVALSAVIMVVAVQHFDLWSLQLQTHWSQFRRPAAIPSDRLAGGRAGRGAVDHRQHRVRRISWDRHCRDVVRRAHEPLNHSPQLSM